MASQSDRVPAWKKLGLKLKYADENQSKTTNTAILPTKQDIVTSTPTSQEKSQVPQISQDNAPSGEKSKRKRKRKRKSATDGDEPIERSRNQLPQNNNVKKPKSASDHVSRHLTGEDQADDPSSDLAHQSKSLGTKARVKFSGDTKQEDGPPPKATLEQWESANPGDVFTFFAPTDEDPSISSSQPSLKTKEPTDDSLKSKKSKKSKPKKEKLSKTERAARKAAASAQQALADPATVRVPRYLEYLLQYHDDRENWKFNKARQREILKHAHDVDAIPTTYDAALSRYVQGLHGSMAGDRLYESCGGSLPRPSVDASVGKNITEAVGDTLPTDRESKIVEQISEQWQERHEATIPAERLAVASKRNKLLIRALIVRPSHAVENGQSEKKDGATSDEDEEHGGVSLKPIEAQKGEEQIKLQTRASDDDSDRSAAYETASE